jgi:hypothetical protein
MYVQFWLKPKDTACDCGCQMPKKASGNPVVLTSALWQTVRAAPRQRLWQ